MKSASWVVRDRGTQEILFETFDQRVVDALNTDRYEAIPILEHLQTLNRK